MGNKAHCKCLQCVDSTPDQNQSFQDKSGIPRNKQPNQSPSGNLEIEYDDTKSKSTAATSKYMMNHLNNCGSHKLRVEQMNEMLNEV